MNKNEEEEYYYIKYSILKGQLAELLGRSRLLAKRFSVVKSDEELTQISKDLELVETEMACCLKAIIVLEEKCSAILAI